MIPLSKEIPLWQKWKRKRKKERGNPGGFPFHLIFKSDTY